MLKTWLGRSHDLVSLSDISSLRGVDILKLRNVKLTSFRDPDLPGYTTRDDSRLLIHHRQRVYPLAWALRIDASARPSPESSSHISHHPCVILISTY
jgi:hypothetical protein